MTEQIPSISRVSRSKEEAKANYNKLSRWYDWIAGHSEKKYRDAGLTHLAVKPGESIAELGFGTGHCLVALARAVGDKGRVDGVDLSEGMASISRLRLRKEGLLPRVNCHVGDAVEVTAQWQKDFYDAVFMSFTLELFDTPELPSVLASCHRILRPGGRICSVSLFRPERDTWPVRLYEWAHRVMPQLVDCRPIRSKVLFLDAGFQILQVTMMKMWGLPVEIILAQKPAI